MIKKKNKAILCSILSLGFIISIESINVNAMSSQNINSVKFTDIDESWAKQQIEELASLGYINGYSDGSFKPKFSITRSEFVKILNNTFGLTNSSGKVFSDTQNHWAKNEIDIAVTNGVCKGKSDTEFKPDDKITREEAALMIANYKKLEDSNHDKINAFNDGENVSDWAKDGVEGVIEKGYMNGYEDNTFNFRGAITREEAVVLLSRVNKSEENVEGKPSNPEQNVEGQLAVENANKVIEKINKLNRAITKDDEKEILEARNAYNSLSEESKSLVNNLDILEKAERASRKIRVVNLIDNIGRNDNKNDTPEDRIKKYVDDVKKAKEAYDALSEEEQNAISPLDREFLSGSLVTINEIKKEAEDKLIAEKLVERINNLKNYKKYTKLEEKRAIAKEVYDIRDAYEGLAYLAQKRFPKESLDILKKAELSILNNVGDLLDPIQKG